MCPVYRIQFKGGLTNDKQRNILDGRQAGRQRYFDPFRIGRFYEPTNDNIALCGLEQKHCTFFLDRIRGGFVCRIGSNSRRNVQ